LESLSPVRSRGGKRRHARKILQTFGKPNHSTHRIARRRHHVPHDGLHHRRATGGAVWCDVRNENRHGLRRSHDSDVFVCRACDCTDGVARALSHRASARHGHKFFLHILHDSSGEGGGFCRRLAGRAGRRVHFRGPVPDLVAGRPARDDLQRHFAEHEVCNCRWYRAVHCVHRHAKHRPDRQRPSLGGETEFTLQLARLDRIFRRAADKRRAAREKDSRLDSLGHRGGRHSCLPC